ncbi:MAG: hypothetical protein EB101_09100 [Chitinophagia bacterium]|nr:hypothetical protein [Chitinophagia bacterium]
MNTISQEYREIQMQLHLNPNYGVMSVHYAPLVKDILEKTNAGSLCDYGAGKKRLLESLRKLGAKDFDYFPYDPAFPEYGDAQPADLVTCIDVLEHIEPNCLANVISELAQITRCFGLFTVHTGPAIKVLPDGRNAHLIQQQSGWWLERLSSLFNVIELQSVNHGFWVLVEPRK